MPDSDLLSPVRAIFALREADVTAIAQALPGIDGTLSLDRHEGYDGDLTVLISPGDESLETFVVCRSTDGYKLASSVGDDYRVLGVFPSVVELMRIVGARHAAPRDDKTG